ncbi:hypothetical protein NQ317_006426, partial [Molorchus minor]
MVLTREIREEIEEAVNQAVSKTIKSDSFIKTITNNISTAITKTIENKLSSLAKSVAELRKNFDEENLERDKKIEALQECLRKDKIETIKMKEIFDKLDQTNRVKCLRIFNMPEKTKEDTRAEMINIFNTKMNLKITTNDIQICYRIVDMLEFINVIDNDETIETKECDNFYKYFQERLGEGKRNLGIIHFNIRSIKKHLDELMVYVQMANEFLDVIVLSETRAIESVKIYLGDININLLNTENNEVNQYLNILGSNGFLSYINRPTRVTKDTKSAIDHIFVRKENCLKNKILISPIIFQTDMTDHFTPFINIKFLKNNTPGLLNSSEQQKIQKIDFNKLNSALRSEKWESAMLETNPQHSYNIFIGKLTNYITECTETKLVKYKKQREQMCKSIKKTNLPEHFQSDIKVQQSIFLKPVTKNELILIISNLKNNSAPGPDKITTKTIKTIHNNILDPLIHIINQCLLTGVIPQQWKVSNITPVLKSEHISYVAKRLRALMHKFYELRDILSRKNLVILYNSLANSIIQYCIPAWGATFKIALSPLQTAQNMILKIIFKKNKLYPTSLLYQETNILNIRLIYIFQCLKRMFHEQTKFSQQHLKETRSK